MFDTLILNEKEKKISIIQDNNPIISIENGNNTSSIRETPFTDNINISKAKSTKTKKQLCGKRKGEKTPRQEGSSTCMQKIIYYKNQNSLSKFHY